MDIIPYLLGIGLTVAAVYWYLANSRRPSGTPTVGLFRYHETVEPAPAARKSPAPAARKSPAPAARKSPAPAARKSPAPAARKSPDRTAQYRVPHPAAAPPATAPRPSGSVGDALAEAARALGGSGEPLRPPRK